MLILPKTAIDEFALGYAGRICHINIWKSLPMTMRALMLSFDLKARSGAYLQALALAAGMNIPRFVHMHTLLPVSIERLNVINGRAGGKAMYRTGDEKNPLYLCKKYAYFCNDCIVQQRQEVGFAYWNRIHQLPGIYWCPWHQKELTAASFTHISQTVPSTMLTVDTRPLGYKGTRESPFIHQYGMNMAKRLVHGNEHVTYAELTNQLRTKAEAAGLNVDREPNDSPYLSDLVFNTMPAWWLAQEYPGGKKALGEFFEPIDDALQGQSIGAKGYALAMALLCSETIW